MTKLLFLLLGFMLSAQAAPYIVESFENVASLSDWWIINNSTPGGQTPQGWFQGSGIFEAQSGSPDSYIQANFENAGSPGDISTWLLSPVLSLHYGLRLQFYTIAEDVPGFPDRLEVRLSRAGGSTNVGSDPTSVGDFTELLLVVNPTLADAGYPTGWTPYEYVFDRLTGPVDGRVAFRYFVPDRTVNGSTIAIDTVYIVPEPATGALVAISLGLVLQRRLRRRHLQS